MIVKGAVSGWLRDGTGARRYVEEGGESVPMTQFLFFQTGVVGEYITLHSIQGLGLVCTERYATEW